MITQYINSNDTLQNDYSHYTEIMIWQKAVQEIVF